MKKLLLTALTLIVALTISSCAASPKASDTASVAAIASASISSAVGTSQKITPQDVKKMMDNGDAITIVDVRTLGEYNSAHIKGAISIPVETIGKNKPAQLANLNAVIIVYCQTGARSAVAAQELAALGYTKVSDMGGINSWTYATVSTTAASPSASAGAAAAGGLLSSFKTTDMDGKPVDASIFSGHKLTMVNVWATFCGPCISEMPELGKLNAQYKDKGLQLIGIVVDTQDNNGAILPDMVSQAKEIVTKTGAAYLHLLPSADLNKLLLNQISAVPTTLFVDAKGKQVGELVVGSHTASEWAKIIDGLLKGIQ